jgi:hypothetical protein
MDQARGLLAILAAWLLAGPSTPGLWAPAPANQPAYVAVAAAAEIPGQPAPSLGSGGRLPSAPPPTPPTAPAAPGPATAPFSAGSFVFDPETNSLPRLVETNYLELAKVAAISKFRSAAGHDYSDDFETCRSMKHYFQPEATVDWASVRIISPVAGAVFRTEDEWAGTRVEIQAAQCPAFCFTLFHVRLVHPLRPGDKVAAGQWLGFHCGHETCSDIAVSINTPKGRKLVSYFDVMSDRVFQAYRVRGVPSRDELIVSRPARDADPLTCQDGKFIGRRPGGDWVQLRGAE